MSYLALYRKWRPKTFEDVVGQSHVSDTLQRAIRENKVAHAYLFAGPRGTGKTSMAKILARAINCEIGPTDHPCHTCESCRQMLSGQSLDVIEIDAASNRGIDEVRSLREQINFLPVLGQKKIFIIDEAHMLTNEAWNALLKTIEEPPAHILFIFATTEAEKLPVTILSRCQRYTFRRITSQDITEHLLYVAKESGIALDRGAAQVIAVHSDGGLRDALSTLDQCSGMTSDVITASLVESIIGLVSKEWVLSMVDTLRHGDGAGLLKGVQEALQVGRDARQIVIALVEHLRALIVARVLPDAEELLAYDVLRERLLAQSQEMSLEDISRYINVLQQVQQDAKQVDNPRVIVEMGLLSLLQLGGGSYQTLESRLTTIEQFVNRQEDRLLERLEGMRPVVAPVQTVTAAPDIVPSLVEREEYGEEVMTPFLEEEYEPQPSSMTKQASSTVKQVDLPRGGESLSQKKTSKPLLGPPLQGAPPPKKGRVKESPKKESAYTNDGIGRGVVHSQEYSRIQTNVIKWMMSHGRIMLTNVYKTGRLIYVDQDKAILEFKTDVAVKLLSQSRQIEDGQQAFQQVLGRPLVVQGILSSDPQVAIYKEAAQGTNGREVVDSVEEITTKVATIEDAVPTPKIEKQSPPILESKGVSQPIVETISPAHSGVGAGSAPTNLEGIIDDFLTVYDNPEEALNPYYIPPFQEEDNGKGKSVTHLSQWSTEKATEEEKEDPVLYDALQQMEAKGYTIYVEELEESSL